MVMALQPFASRVRRLDDNTATVDVRHSNQPPQAEQLSSKLLTVPWTSHTWPDATPGGDRFMQTTLCGQVENPGTGHCSCHRPLWCAVPRAEHEWASLI